MKKLLFSLWSTSLAIYPASAGQQASVTFETVNVRPQGQTTPAVTIDNHVDGLPRAVAPNLFDSIRCHGDAQHFVGCMAAYFHVADDDTVTAATKGVLYGLDVTIAPRIARGANSPFDDAAGLVISNAGMGNGTEAIYLGHNKALKRDFLAGIGIDASTNTGLYMTGTYNYGIAFTNGASATLTGGALLVPPPRSGTVAVLSAGSDAFTPSHNRDIAKLDHAGHLILAAPAYFCADAYAYDKCVSQTAPIVIESDADAGIAMIDGTGSNGFGIALGPGKDKDLVIDRHAGSGLVRFGPPVRLTPVRLSELPHCSTESEGAQAAVTDSRSDAWGSIVSGGGDHHILAYCDGRDWTVAAR